MSELTQRPSPFLYDDTAGRDFLREMDARQAAHDALAEAQHLYESEAWFYVPEEPLS